MPALQVRDFPDDLYEMLRQSAARNHRSIAQQTIAYVEEGLLSAPPSGDENASSRFINFEEITRKAKRIEKRINIFSNFRNVKWFDTPPTPDQILATVHEGREERMSDLMMSAEMPNVPAVKGA